LSSDAPAEPGDLLDALFEKVRDFAGSQPQGDDITAVVVRCREQSAATPSHPGASSGTA
jgi:hypothetical protein